MISGNATVAIVLSIGTAVSVLVFWFMRVWRRRRLTAIPVLSAEGRAPTSGAGTVSILMAARNEEATIDRSVTELLAQDYESVEVVVVNDRSQDRTGDRLAALKGECGKRLTVMTIKTLPAGWTGKCYALETARPMTSGEWLCFTDADCRLSRNAVAAAVASATAAKADLLSVMPELEVRTVWEKIVQPICVMIAFLCTRPDRANDPSSRTAYANGAFILIRRSCLYALGGHARVRAELVEDLRLAQWAKREGYRVHVVQSRGICVTRMYDSPSRFWRGWVRLFASGADSVQHLVRIWALFCAVGLLPALGLAASLLLAWPAPVSSTAGLTVALTWGAALLLQHAAMSRVYHRCRSFSGLVGLLGGWAIVTGILGHAILARAGRVGVIWRGTTYSARRGLGNPLGANSGMPDGSRG